MTHEPTCCHRTKERTEAEYKSLVHRLNRIEGQIRGIRGMLEKSAYCPDILAQAAAANAAYVVDHPGAKPQPKGDGELIKPSAEGIEEKLKGMDPEKVARVRAAMAAKARKAQVANASFEVEKKAEQEALGTLSDKERELEEKLKGMDPEKAAKVRAAMAAKAAKQAAEASGAETKEGE